ncbi:MAG: Mur ligase family protein, partial [Candidatus Saccharimonadales bacterium]
LAHSGNYNTDFGLPLSLFGLETPKKTANIKAWLDIFKQMKLAVEADSYPYEIVILEMGADKPGDIAYLTRYIKPDIGILTAVAKVHLEEFGSIDAVLTEKWHLAAASAQVIYNHDDELLKGKAVELDNVQGYGLSVGGNWADLTTFEFNDASDYGWKGYLNLGQEFVDITFPVIARQSVYALVAAAVIAKTLNLSTTEIVEAISRWQQPPGRMRVLVGKNDSILIDDSYNSSPYAAVAALDTLQQFKGRKIAVLGSMNELGDYEGPGHRLVGKHVDGIDKLVTIGVAANKYLVPAAMEIGFDENNIHETNSPYQAGEFVSSIIRPGDIVLIKGSQNGVYAEEVTRLLLANLSDQQHLVRQSEAWLKIKQEQFS